MRMANDDRDGQLCDVDVYDGRAGAGASVGAYEYNGWAGVHAKLVKRPMPWRPLISEHRPRNAAGERHAQFALTEAGAAAAERLHREAELRGHCTCGLVPKATLAPAPAPDGGGVRPRVLGLRAERLPTLRALLDDRSDEARRLLAWEDDVVAWEAAEADHKRQTEAYDAALAAWVRTSSEGAARRRRRPARRRRRGGAAAPASPAAAARPPSYTQSP